MFFLLIIISVVVERYLEVPSPKWNPLILKVLSPVVQGMDRTIQPINTRKTYFVIHCRALYTVWTTGSGIRECDRFSVNNHRWERLLWEPEIWVLFKWEVVNISKDSTLQYDQ